MAETVVGSGNIVKKWSAKFFIDYMRASQFNSHMGDDENSVIQLVDNLLKEAGDQIAVPLIKKLSGAGVTGSSTLEGQEESLLNYAHPITVNMLRNGVQTNVLEQQRTEINLLNAGRTALKVWAIENLRDAIIAALMAAKIDGKTAYASCTEAEKDAWLVANSDRVQFGKLVSNGSSDDHSTSLANIDNTDDKLTALLVSLCKRRAKTATNGVIRPIMVDGAGEWYVMYAHYLAFRDLSVDTTIVANRQYALDRGRDNPLFSAGDIIHDGVIVKEVPEIPVVGAVGASSIQVVPNFLCGAQAIGVAWAQKTKGSTQVTDYGFKQGAAISEIRGVEKLTYNSVQHGVLTCYTAGVAD